MPSRSGERYSSALTNQSLSNKVYKYFGKVKLKDYIKKFISNNQWPGNSIKLSEKKFLLLSKLFPGRS